MNGTWKFLTHLFDIGRERADQWLAENYDSIGAKGTVDLQARRMQENGPFEVVLKMRVSAQQEEKTIFLLEIAYGGLFVLDKVPDEVMQPLLLIECPRLLFPYVRRIISDLVSDGGLPPLMIEPIDFAALYRSKMVEAQGRQQEAPRMV